MLRSFFFGVIWHNLLSINTLLVCSILVYTSLDRSSIYIYTMNKFLFIIRRQYTVFLEYFLATSNRSTVLVLDYKGI